MLERKCYIAVQAENRVRTDLSKQLFNAKKSLQIMTAAKPSTLASPKPGTGHGGPIVRTEVTHSGYVDNF